MAKRRTLEERARDAKELSDGLARRVAERALLKSDGTMKRLKSAHSAMLELCGCEGIADEVRQHAEYTSQMLALEVERIIDGRAAQ